MNVVGTAGVLLVALACTVGEPQPRSPGPGEGAVPGAEAGGAEGAEGAAADTAAAADAYRATDLLVRSQLAYDAARLDEALSLAEQVLAEHPGSVAAEPARWVAARAAFALGSYRQARELAQAYADRQPSGSSLAEDARKLAALAEDALAEPPATPPVVGAILPRTGPQVLVRYGDFLLQGIMLAVSEVEQQQGRRINLVVVDDSGGTATRRAVAELERRGALAIIGPLLPQQLSVVASARRDPRMVMVSPTATESPRWSEAYSVSAGDSRGAQRLGRYAADVGLTQAALLYARSPEYEKRAEAFAVEYEALGGQVRAMVPYDSGTTTFGPHMDRILTAVAPAPGTDSTLVDRLIAAGLVLDKAEADRIPTDSLLALIELLGPGPGLAGGGVGDTAGAWPGGARQRPFALFVTGPRQDVPKIAPQVSYYGLDSAGVQVFGDDSWASADVRRVVPARDLEGAIVASNFPPDRADDSADPAFVALYENHYRQSLDNPLPALGYDAANLVLQALPNRMLTPDALARRFGFLAAIRGATGLLSVRGGQVVRTPYLLRIHGGKLEEAPYPWEYEMPVPKPPTADTAEGGHR